MKKKFCAPSRALAGFCAASAWAVFAVNAQADVTISSAATQNMSCFGGTCTPTATNAVLNGRASYTAVPAAVCR